MKKTKYNGSSISYCFVTISFLSALGISHASAEVSGVDELVDEQISVRELIRLDTEQALTQARNLVRTKLSVQDKVTRRSRTMSGEPSLSAIYGVGRNLMAEVKLDQDTYLYQQGQALPVGVAPGTDVYVLQNISASCINLKRSDVSHHLCLQQPKWTDR